MWYGTEKLTLDSITCTPDTNLLCATDKNTGVVTISVSAGATLAATNTVKITIRATKNGQQYSRDLTFTVAGVRGGANGADAILYSIVVSRQLSKQGQERELQRVFRIMLQAKVSGRRDIHHNGRYIEIQHRRWNRNYHKQQYSHIKRKLYEDIEVLSFT